MPFSPTVPSNIYLSFCPTYHSLFIWSLMSCPVLFSDVYVCALMLSVVLFVSWPLRNILFFAASRPVLLLTHSPIQCLPERSLFSDIKRQGRKSNSFLHVSTGKCQPRTGHAGPDVKLEVWLCSFFNLSAVWCGWSKPSPSASPLRKRSGTHCRGGLGGPHGGCGRVRKILPSQGFHPLTVLPVPTTLSRPTSLHTISSLRMQDATLSLPHMPS